MKSLSTFALLFLFLIGKAQDSPSKDYVAAFKKCESEKCKISNAFLAAEYYLEIDNLTASQKWLDIAKNRDLYKEIDTTDVFINSLQSELFYYNGLFQFGINEAEKVITNSIQLKDSVLISNGYFFKGINLFEMNKLKAAENMLWKSRNFQPKVNSAVHLRSAILNEHIYNNIAQIKLQMREQDSAIWYNSRAYDFAKKTNSKRGIPNIEQTYSQIYISQNKIADAQYYLMKSNASAMKNNYYDIVLANYGYLLHCYPKNSPELIKWFNDGIILIKEKKINISYQVTFFRTAIKAFRNYNQLKELAFAQEQLLNINQKITLSNSDYIQNITKQYLKNENKLLKQELNLIKSTKEKQIFYFIVAALILLSIGLWYIFKQRQERKNQEIETLKRNQEINNLEALIDGEETERKRIAQELHDGLNGDLSAIKYRLSAFEETKLDDEDRGSLLKSIEMIDNACAQVRGISHNLMPTSILDYGLVETVQQYCAKINSTHPLTLEFQYFGDAAVLPKKAETVIYRIIQELITNISKHSKASLAMVQLNFHENELSITVEDNGVGFNQKSTQTGLGLKNINSRVQFLNAQLEIDSSKNGTSFHITVNLKKLKND